MEKPESIGHDAVDPAIDAVWTDHRWLMPFGGTVEIGSMKGWKKTEGKQSGQPAVNQRSVMDRAAEQTLRGGFSSTSIEHTLIQPPSPTAAWLRHDDGPQVIPIGW